MKKATVFIAVLILFSGLFIWAEGLNAPLSPKDLLSLKSISSLKLSPNGKFIAYTLSTPPKPDDKPGTSQRELFLIELATGTTKAMIRGKVNIGSIGWCPKSMGISYVAKRGSDDQSQLYFLPLSGGESIRLTNLKYSVSSYQWHPSGQSIVFISSEPRDKREKFLSKKGYRFIYYEENLKHRNLYQYFFKDKKLLKLSSDVTVWSFNFGPAGKKILYSASPKNLIDHRYMFRNIFILNLKSKKTEQLTEKISKKGNFQLSPDGNYLAYTAALDKKDHQVSQLFVIDLLTKKEKNLTPQKFPGHIGSVFWKDNKTLYFNSGEGTYPKFSQIALKGGPRKIILDTKNLGVVYRGIEFSRDYKTAVFVGQAPNVSSDIYFWNARKKSIKRLTRINPLLDKRLLGLQKVIQYTSRDGVPIEGILILPVNYKKGTTYPLVLQIHGGPESHYSNGWLSGYSSPGQVLAGKGYAVFYPNYRASTGYGVPFAMAGYEDPAGKEFDDIADGIDFLIKEGIVDRHRVGLGGGSYGGYASGWFATYYTKYVKAVCMFVGISNLVSKRGTTDIPYEELYVHAGKKLEQDWEFAYKRSPLYYAHQSKTATLIMGGTNDTRVPPEQSVQMYRRMKMNDHPAVRLVQYPGEGHGNRRHPGQIDLLYRVLAWYDWYVKDLKPLNGPMPPLDISDKYGLELPK